jgi:hypothetical protein
VCAAGGMNKELGLHVQTHMPRYEWEDDAESIIAGAPCQHHRRALLSSPLLLCVLPLYCAVMGDARRRVGAIVFVCLLCGRLHCQGLATSAWSPVPSHQQQVGAGAAVVMCDELKLLNDTNPVLHESCA